MKAKEFKELVSQIPDEDEVIFTYSMFEFENVGDRLYRGSQIKKYFKDEGHGEDAENIPHGKNCWMIEFDN